jgi:glyoxylase-like metal-dependent hydrolase (beta-lactamase superfamily II)
VPAWICETCGVQHADTDEPPAGCAICLDERQYVGRQGQRWTTLGELRAERRAEIRDDGGLLGIGCEPQFAIGQRALLVESVLWGCTPLLDGMVDVVAERRGLSAIAIDHPHFYSTAVEWSRAFAGVPVYVHVDDREWIMRPDPCWEVWHGEELDLGGGLTLLRLGGHFAGGQVLHWAGGNALLAGDVVSVVADRRYVSFMYSYPNLIPLPASAIRRIAEKLEPWQFDKIYGGWWGTIVEQDGKEAVRRSAERYISSVGG